jgi:hypothetical protein
MAKKAPTHPLDALAAGDPKKVIALMLWKARHQQPSLYAQINEDDLETFGACVRYLKTEPEISITRPQGVPAQAAIPAQGNRRAVPARAAIPPRPYVIVALVDKKTGDAVRPVENNQDDFDRAAETQQVLKARQDAPLLAQRILHQAATGEYSLSDLQDAAQALNTLARAVAPA